MSTSMSGSNVSSDFDSERLRWRSPAQLQYTVAHVFLPARFPRPDYSVENDHFLARAACLAAHSYCEIIDDTLKPQWYRIAKMLDRLQSSVQSWQSECLDIISWQLHEMLIGDILTFFNPAQDAAVVFRKQDHCTVYESFQTSWDSVSTPEGSYPEWAIEIPNEVFDNQSFQFGLANFLLYPNQFPSHKVLPEDTTSAYTRLLTSILRSVGHSIEFPRIIKRVHSHFKFRARSSLWLLIKVAIQTSLDYGDLGRICYKTFMLHFMCRLAKDAIDASLSSGGLHAISAKILRRLKKLGSSSPNWLYDMVLKTTASLRETLAARWKEIEDNRPPPPLWRYSQLELERDIHLSLMHSKEYIRNSLTNLDPKPVESPFRPERLLRGALNNFFSSNGSLFEEAYHADPYVALYDVEQAVEGGIDDWVACVTDVDQACAQLATLMQNYLSGASLTYEGNPEHLSITLLTVIELWVVLDKLVVRAVPILADYSPEVPTELLRRPLFRKTGNLHRLRRAYQYLSGRHSQSLPGKSVFSDEFTRRMFPVRHRVNPEDLRRHIWEHGLTIPSGYDIVVFELQCPVSLHIWRCAISSLLHFSPWSTSIRLCKRRNGESVALAKIHQLQPFLFKHWTSPISGLVYLACLGLSVQQLWGIFTHVDRDNWLVNDEQFAYPLQSSPKLHPYIIATSHTSNGVLAAHVQGLDGLSIHEFIAFGHLRSGGSLQWANILRELRSRTLNLRRHEIYFLFAQAATEIGLLDLNTAEWFWHQELQDPIFCDTLLDELEGFFIDVVAHSFDGVMMGTISFLLTRLLASCCDESISDRAIRLIRQVRTTTFQWVQEFSYSLMLEPMNTERSDLLRDMAATCRSTFDVGPDVTHRLLCSAEDVDALLSCAIFIHANSPSYSERIPKYSRLLLERDRRLSLALEDVLRDAIEADASDRGIDLAVRRVWYGYRPGPRKWQPLPHPNSQWLTCDTAAIGGRRSQTMHLNLLNGTLLVDGKPIDGLPLEIREQPTYERIFGNQRFLAIASDLPGMDLSTLALISEHQVHFAMRGGNLVIQAQHKDTSDILEVVPQEKLWPDLPATFVHRHVHWLNLSTSIIEIRPLEKVWEESFENWRIDCRSGKYHMYKGRESLVDIQSQTWGMVSGRLECLDVTENLIITTFPIDTPESPPIRRLSVALPRYNLSFFFNEDGDLESRDFKGMVYDEGQCIGTLFGLKDKLVLRPKAQAEEELVHRSIIIPDGPLVRECHSHHVYIKIDTRDPSDTRISRKVRLQPVTYHTYKINTDLGCLTGHISWKSKMYLAHLHAETSVDWWPDPLTGRTGIQEALSLLQSAGCRSFMELDIRHEKPELLSSTDYWMYPQINFAIQEINYLIDRERFLRTNQNIDPPERPLLDVISALRLAYLLPFEVVGPSIPMKTGIRSHKPSQRGDIAYTISLVVYHSLINTENGANSRCDTGIAYTPFTSPAWANPDLLLPWITEVDALLQEATELYQRFQLLFLLPVAVYRQENPFPHFLSILAALARRCHTSGDVLLCCFASVRRSTFIAKSDEDLDSAMDQLFTAWRWLSETAPVVPVMVDDIKELNTSLQKFFSSGSCHGLEPKEGLINRLPEHESKLVSVPDQAQSSRQRYDPPPKTCVRMPSQLQRQVTLGELLRDRSAPKIPAPVPLQCRSPRGNRRSSNPDSDTKLNQLLAFLRIDRTSPSFQKQYVSRLHSSARHVREESRMTCGVARRPTTEELQKYYVRCRDDYVAGITILKKELGPVGDPFEQALDQSGQWPKITPDTLFRCLTSTSPIKLSDSWKNCLVSLALLLLQLQRARRLLQFALDKLEEDLCKELENEGCDGWNAEEYPDWLLIQLQGNFLIRGIQADAAIKMISPPSGENTVMQVNMGEGKSSVILPISAATLADGIRLARVIVPKALTVQMFRLLVGRLGGLANRPIYHLPFSRSLTGRYSCQQFKILRELLSECLRNRGILVVQPENVLSLKLTSIQMQLLEWQTPDLYNSRGFSNYKSDSGFDSDSNHNGDSDYNSDSNSDNDSDTSSDGTDETSSVEYLVPSHASLELQKWFDSYARDIVDESDDALHPGFQLIYTLGQQRYMQGYPDRWTITQQVLRLVRKHALSLSHDLPEAIEYELAPSGSFPRLRILRASDARQRLISLIVDDVMDGHLPSVSFRDVDSDRRLRAAVCAFISSKDIFKRTAKIVEEYARERNLWNGILLLRGLLACNILSFALAERRWRVDYGLDLKRTMLAVPYRAKDVPATRAEFGHPDITIVLTCLSYYYGGLSEVQLRASFQILQERDDPSTEYANWLRDYDPGSLPESIRDISNVNTKSSEQWDKYLFPLFARNQGAVDLYLSQVVFPIATMEFPWKVAASSWDLAEVREHPVTGFSGTNDCQYLLPTSITQRDLDHQRGTNAKVLSHLLQSENNSYMLLSHANGERLTTLELLRTVVDQEPEIRVILDVGAQILDFSNYEVAKAWLDISPNSDGAIYFNEDDELMVLTKGGTARSLLSSPLVQQLDRCVVYLDDAHTRGTDLKFPSGFRAAVTLGPKVTKDRLVQGCMRMRKLGHGHSVMFFAPLEVDQSIRAVAAKKDQDLSVTTTDILCWAIHETWTDIQRRGPYWAQQGISHHFRYHAWTRFCSGEITREQLADPWLQAELKSLADLYAPFQPQDASSCSSALDDHPEICQHCIDLGVLKLPEAQMEEEQEREISREIEREREVERWPHKEIPEEHSLHPDVVAFVKTGAIPATSGAFHPISMALEGSSAATTKEHFWSPLILATADFCKTIKPGTWQGSKDEFLRPVQWVLSGKRNLDRVLVLLSPFETDCLMPDIRVSKHVHLHVYTPRTSERMRATDDLMLYSIPPVPNSWTPPWDLIDQLNLFAGQLYLRDYESYLGLRRFLGIHRSTPPKNVATAIQRNRVTPSVLEEIGNTFKDSPLPSVMMLLAIRRRGLPFAGTHMGRILQGQPLTKEDFKSTTRERPDRNPAALSRSSKRERETANPSNVDESSGRRHKRLRAGHHRRWYVPCQRNV